MAKDEALLRLENISKDFYGTKVLKSVSFQVKKGEILGLVGENGAGKTTLMHILFGMPVITDTGGYGGQLYVDGIAVNFSGPFDALDAGIGMVHQEFSLIPGFTTAENIMLNREILRPSIAEELFGPRLRRLDRPSMRQRTLEALSRLGVAIDPDMLIAEMPVGHKQFTEIAREIDRPSIRLLVLDEPTAVLTESEAVILLKALRRLADEGIAIIFISHRLPEILEICDTIVTLRDGVVVKNLAARGHTVREIALWMVGREISTEPSATDEPDSPEVTAGIPAVKRPSLGDEVFRAENLWVDMPGETVRDLSFTVREAEILGIGGLAGQGKLGIPNGIMGLFPAGGRVFLQGKEFKLGDPTAVLAAGMAFVSEDRRGVGLLLDESLDWNIAFTAMQVKGEYLKSYFGGLFKLRDEKAMRRLAWEYIKALEIKCTSHRQPAKELSGGNQQKLCLSKAFALKPKLLFVSEPTRGIDVGAKKLVLDTLRRYNNDFGTSIVMVSSELEELRRICDRIAIVAEGRISGILKPEADLAEFGLLMSGIGVQP